MGLCIVRALPLRDISTIGLANIGPIQVHLTFVYQRPYPVNYEHSKQGVNQLPGFFVR
jgi:hypothetical protein